MKTLDPGVARVLKRLYYPPEVILTCVRWYVAYPLKRHAETVTIDKNGANLAALQDIDAERETPIKIRQVKYLNNIVE